MSDRDYIQQPFQPPDFTYVSVVLNYGQPELRLLDGSRNTVGGIRLTEEMALKIGGMLLEAAFAAQQARESEQPE